MTSGENNMSEKPPFLATAARWTRVAIVAAIAIVLGLIVTTPRNDYPLTMSRAQAAGVGAAPGFICTTLAEGNANHFFLIDTKNKVVCVYAVLSDRLRLVAGRKFDIDSDVVDASFAGKVRLEGGNGLQREDTKIYIEEVMKPALEKLEKKK